MARDARTTSQTRHTTRGGRSMNKGYFQIYTGNGKGKTTAALGLALRAAGAGLQVYLGQFMKSMEYHEIGILKERVPEIQVELFGMGCIVDRDAGIPDIRAARDGVKRSLEILHSGSYDIVILDEIFIALYFNLITREDLENLLEAKPSGTELVMTGRYAPEWLLEKADLVTEMREVRHYYEAGVEARDGIER
ncbi:cob(I)yrinic acid a,c-diamide adenosyltransferase [Hornefia butyriciproducens]|uniref:cob(I)yrinic acid a,c-diamide adenosyltransferase n=1 Tax=Hornefia butyriciproducens TaxID=2652293 RepID=UPI002A91B8E9|nr:cob(I)yrinic acid a,c-diamide adenosyltransferase [Hornefia butyriciproducens]MDY5462137.1 cob(I)yrinic acid a,c-diamide adenosyltransferase [Hornefia butyriciproducens]